jgi:hypothetical protein
MPIYERPIIYCLGIENTRMGDCDIVRPNGYQHDSPIEKLKEYRKKNKHKEKNSIFIYKDCTAYIFEIVN